MAATPEAGMPEPRCLLEGALAILMTADPWGKQRQTVELARLWRSGNLPIFSSDDKVTTLSSGLKICRLPERQSLVTIPDRPARDDVTVKLIAPRDMPKLGKGGTLASRQEPSYRLPRAFYDDFVTVAEDECRHFTMLASRLKEIGSYYGALPGHDGLWESATTTSASLPARLAVEHCVHEARGLDVLPGTIRRLRDGGDETSAELLESVIYPEEISHCAAGVRWLRHLHAVAHGIEGQSEEFCSSVPEQKDAAARLDDGCTQTEAVHREGTEKSHCSERDEARAAGLNGAEAPNAQDESDVPDWIRHAREHDSVTGLFHSLVRAHFKGNTKPPFNTEARARAGFLEEWYLPLAQTG